MLKPLLDRSNNDDRRQWRKQGVAVGAAASKTQAKRCGCWVPQPGQWQRVSADGEVIPIKCITLLPVGHTAQRKEGLFVQTFYKICLILMIVGGINWGLVGLFQFDFVGWLLGGSASIWSRIVFTLVGVAAICGVPGLFTDETGE